MRVVDVGRNHGEFLLLLYILAHYRTARWFAKLGDTQPTAEAFEWRRGEYFWHMCATTCRAAACALAQRAQVAEHTLRWYDA